MFRCSVLQRLSVLLVLGCLALPSPAFVADESVQETPSEKSAPEETLPKKVVTENTADEAAAEEPAADESPKFTYVRMETSKGPVLLELDNDNAPISTANFVEYVEDGTYDGTIFHRVIPNFMIQGGGFDADLKQRETRDPIKNEWENGLSNTRGTVAMARTGDPDSATCQFFINVKDNLFLDQGRDPGTAGYAVFGRVIDGMNTVDAIRYVKTARQQMPNMPVETVTIDRMTILNPEEAKTAMEDAAKKQAEAPETPVYPGDATGDATRVETESGLAYYDLVEGDGAAPQSAGSTATVHYTGWLTDGTKFDSSVDRGQPIDFPLNGVIEGWTEGVQSMKVGGKRKLIIPPDLGYGPQGAGGVIPPNATLIFDVELLDVQD